MITEESIIIAIEHYNRTREILDILVPFFKQNGMWAGDRRNWNKSTSKKAAALMAHAFLPENRRIATNEQGEPILLTSFHSTRRRPIAIPWFEVKGSIRIRSLEEISCENLRMVGGYIYSSTDSEVNLPNLLWVGGDFDFQETLKLYAPVLKEVRGSVMVVECDLPQLEVVGNRFWGIWTDSLQLPMLRCVGGSIEVEIAEKFDAPALVWVGFDLILSHLTTEFRAIKLVEVGGSLHAGAAAIIHAPMLEHVGDGLHTESAQDFYKPDYEDFAYWDKHPEARRRWEMRQAVRQAMSAQPPIDI